MKMTDWDMHDVAVTDTELAQRAVRLHDLIKLRDQHFRRTVMADSAMSIMLSLLLSEIQSVALTESTLTLVNFLDEGETRAILAQLIHAGLVEANGQDSERRSVGLSALGSARMRSYVSGHPQI
jgi:HD superfamily phosphodiesterase